MGKVGFSDILDYLRKERKRRWNTIPCLRMVFHLPNSYCAQNQLEFPLPLGKGRAAGSRQRAARRWAGTSMLRFGNRAAGTGSGVLWPNIGIFVQSFGMFFVFC